MIILLLLLLLLLYFVLVAVNARYKENLVALVIDEAHCVKTWRGTFSYDLLAAWRFTKYCLS